MKFFPPIRITLNLNMIIHLKNIIDLPLKLK